MARIVISPEASADQQEILQYLAGTASRLTSAKYDAAFDALFDRLALQPESAAPRPRLGRNIRLSIVHPYNIYSRYDAAIEILLVLRILHGRRRVRRGMMRP